MTLYAQDQATQQIEPLPDHILIFDGLARLQPFPTPQPVKAADLLARELPGWVRSGRRGRHHIKPVQR